MNPDFAKQLAARLQQQNKHFEDAQRVQEEAEREKEKEIQKKSGKKSRLSSKPRKLLGSMPAGGVVSVSSSDVLELKKKKKKDAQPDSGAGILSPRGSTRGGGVSFGGDDEGGADTPRSSLFAAARNRDFARVKDLLRDGGERDLSGLGHALINGQRMEGDSLPPSTMSEAELSSLRSLWEERPVLSSQKDSRGRSALHALLAGGVWEGYPPALLDTVKAARGVPTSETDGEGGTLLSALFEGATRVGDESIIFPVVQHFVEYKVPLNQCGRGQDAPLLVAIRMEMPLCVDLLLESGADVMARTGKDEDARDLCATCKSAQIVNRIGDLFEKRRVAQMENVVNEIVQTELSHSRFLQVLIDVYLIPMQTDLHLSQKCLDCLFANIQELLENSVALGKDLEQESSRPDQERRLGLIFLNHIKNIEAHVKYCEAMAVSDQVRR